MKRYRAILFDMDGVIVDSMHKHAEAWQRVFYDYGISLTKEEIFKREGMSGRSSIVDIIKEKEDRVPDKDEQSEILQKKLEIFERGQIKVYPFIREILEYIQSQKIEAGLVTGSLRRSVQFVLPEDMKGYFNVIITVDDIQNGKPHPESYIRAMEELECNTKNTLVIENAPLGITAAKRAGLDCFAIETTLESPFLKEADKIFQNHRLLLEYLKGRF